MKPIGAYTTICTQLSIEEFCQQQAPAFLLHAQNAAALKPPGSTQVSTLERVVLTDGLGNRGDALQDQPLSRTLERSNTTREFDPLATPVSADGPIELLQTPYLVFPLGAPETPSVRLSLGCSSRCDVTIGDESVSALHAYVERRGDGYLVEDNDSTTGTQLNDQTIRKGMPHPLASGDRLTLGYIDLIFLTASDFYRFLQRFFGP